jgi:hypothetical protein
VILPALALVAALVVPVHDDPPKPHGNDTGCCFSFDNSPVNIVFCTTKDACTIAPPK